MISACRVAGQARMYVYVLVAGSTSCRKMTPLDDGGMCAAAEADEADIFECVGSRLKTGERVLEERVLQYEIILPVDFAASVQRIGPPRKPKHQSAILPPVFRTPASFTKCLPPFRLDFMLETSFQDVY